MVDRCPGPDAITRPVFDDALAGYDKLIEAVSASKGAQPAQKTLAELDRYRYSEAPALFASTSPRPAMELRHVEHLVQWKLKHGKFRPSLMKLVSSNEGSFVKDTVGTAVDLYNVEGDASAAVDILTRLKGIGPATASLLLAVHDPQNVIFFADEAFLWLCNDGKTGPIKYNAKEYRKLNENSQKLGRRLGVRAMDVERVAYVLLNGTPSKRPSNHAADVRNSSAASKKTSSATNKRKQQASTPSSAAPRRSKRSKWAS